MTQGSTWRAIERDGIEVIAPIWPVDARVDAFVTQRVGGTSAGPYASLEGGGLNLAMHVGDEAAVVQGNRDRLATLAPAWLDQVHGTATADLDRVDAPRVADAAWTARSGITAVVMVADCLPVFVADRDGRVVGVAHAGWRGLVSGVIESLVDAMSGAVARSQLVAWLGPCIGPDAFEVGPEVRAAFVAGDADAARHFRQGRGDRWQADLAGLAASRLARAGVGAVVASGLCTVSEAGRFFSYRRDGVTGRIGAFISRS